MTAGSGIAHSERTPPELRPAGSRLHGLQLWVGLPQAQEEAPPDFTHYPASVLPEVSREGQKIRVMIGEAFGACSPVKTLSEIFYADVELAAGAALDLPADHEERGIYIISGALTLDGQRYDEHQLLVLNKDAAATLTAAVPSRLVVLGGAKLDGERHIWWNLVSSSEARIDQAKADWKEGRFAKVPGETEFIPLPE
jgi:redox-sensitive bicupin YhaK (pirin superfamily)